MNNTDNHISKSKTFKYFNKNTLNDTQKRNLLVSLEEILAIKKNIRIMFGTDDSEKLKNFIGKKYNNTLVTKKDYEYSLLISKTYNDLYEKCKQMLEDDKKK